MARPRRSRGKGPARPPSLIAWGVGAVVVTMLVIGGLGLSGLGSASATHVGSSVDLSLQDMAGKTIRLGDYRGHPVLVNLWASWCPPCRAEMPDLIRFYKDHQSSGLVVLAVNSDDELGPAEQSIHEEQIPFSVLYDPDGKAMRVFGVDGLPSSFLVDRNGILRFSWTGEITRDVLDSRVLPLLAQ